MKTLEQVQKEENIGRVYATEDFKKSCKSGFFIPYDGCGHFHDGEKDTDVSVWDCCGRFNWREGSKYPYVIWFNR